MKIRKAKANIKEWGDKKSISRLTVDVPSSTYHRFRVVSIKHKETITELVNMWIAKYLKEKE